MKFELKSCVACELLSSNLDLNFHISILLLILKVMDTNSNPLYCLFTEKNNYFFLLISRVRKEFSDIESEFEFDFPDFYLQANQLVEPKSI